MDFLKKFRDYLARQDNLLSKSTLKNYKADVSRFIRWFEAYFNKIFDPTAVTPQIIEIYKASQKQLSASSLDRHLSSLRKFFYFLKLEGIVSLSPMESKQNSRLTQKDIWRLKDFKNFLYIYNSSYLTIKNYIIDIRQFLKWLEKVTSLENAWNREERNIFEKIDTSSLEEYRERLLTQHFSPRTINRKLSSLRKYIAWLESEGLIQSSETKAPLDLILNQSNSNLIQKQVSVLNKPASSIYSGFAPVRLLQKIKNAGIFAFDKILILPLANMIDFAAYLVWKVKGKKVFVQSSTQPAKEKPAISNIEKSFYAPISSRYFPFPKKIWHHLKHTRPQWYKRYHSYSFSHYLHLAILILFVTTIGFFLYGHFLKNPQSQNSVLGTLFAGPPRTLSFQGRLTDTSGNPISGKKDLRFAIYNDPTSSGSALLWQEVASVNADREGAFEVFLGKETLIDQSIFSQNPALYMGITVGGTAELIPRQKIASVALAESAQSLEGLLPITKEGAGTANVVLALDSSGNLNIGGSANPIFRATEGALTLSGKALVLETLPDSNSNIVINPNGLGQIDIQKPIQNTLGNVEFADSLTISATASGQPAFVINQNAQGPLIVASSSGAPKFTLEENGTGTFANNLLVNGSSLTTISSIFNLLNANVTTLNFAGAAATLTIGSPLGIATIQNALTSITGVLNVMGNAGVGISDPLFRLDVRGNKDSTAAAQIYNASQTADADGLIVKLGNNSTAVNPNNHFLSFETLGAGIVGSIQGNGTNGVTYKTEGIADFAEYFKKDESENIEYGSVVCMADNGLITVCNQNNRKVIGVASEHPAFVGGENLGSKSIAVGLIGQIYIKVSNDNGTIQPGDPLALGSNPGSAVKATNKGQIIGRALEKGTNGKILAYINASWYEPDTDYPKETLDRVKKFMEIAEQVTTKSLAFATDVITIGGQNISGYINSIVSENLKERTIISPIVQTDKLSANIISPLGKDLVVRLSSPSAEIHDSQFIIQNASGSAVAAINSEGNASFSGTLRARKIIADEVESLVAKTATLSANYITNNYNLAMEQYINLASYSSQFANVATLNVEQGLTSLGPTSLWDTAIAGQLSISGSLILDNNSINVLGNDLNLQPLKQGGISIMQGLITIDINGDLKVKGNAEFAKDVKIAGVLSANIISPIQDSDFKIQNSSGSAVFSISQIGDITASGEATFKKLNFSFIQSALALSPTELIASSSAGGAFISPFQTEVTVKNPLVTDKSVIYITPVGTPSAQSPFLMRQVPDGGYFTVGVESPTKNPIPFNWLIVN